MWTCQRCTVENAPAASDCEVCGLSQDATTTDSTEWWQCTHCCQFNFTSQSTCLVCDHPAGPVSHAAKEDMGARATSRATAETMWVCQQQFNSEVCNTSNAMDVYRCAQCAAVKPYLPHLTTLSQVSEVSGHSSSVHTRESSTGEQQERVEEGQQCKSTSPLSSAVSSVGRMETGASCLTGTAEEAVSASLGCLDLDDCQLEQLQDEEVLEFPDSECRLVLVGKTGNGKSATGNTIVGLEQRFQSSFQFGSQTKKCERHNCLRFGIRVELVDTPGLFDTEMDSQTVITEITKCLGVVAPGPHAILLVLRLGVRFTKEENRAVEEVHNMFGVQLLRFLIIVFTHGDELDDLSEDEKEATLKGMLENSPDQLRELLTSANHRYVVFDNTASAESKTRQVKELLTTVSRLLRVNGGRPFTSDLLRMVERCMSDREKELEKELRDRRHRKGSRRQGSKRFFYRDIAREEIVQEKPLLMHIKKQVLPILRSALDILGKLLLGFLMNKMGAGVGDKCELM